MFKGSLNNVDKQYHELVERIFKEGSVKGDRTGTGTKSITGAMMRFDLSDGKIPLLTTKEVKYKSLIHEMLWFISGNTNIRYLKENNVGIWDSWQIKGTEEYTPLSAEECRKAIQKRLAITNTNNLIVPEELTHGETWIVTGNTQLGLPTLYINEKFINNEKRTLGGEADVESWRKLYQSVMGQAAEKLIAADIGSGGYGAQWRQWQDAQLVNKAEVPTYRAQGYEELGVLINGEVVMHREIDQLQNAIELLKNNPDSRRIIVCAWNPGMIWKAALPPCHLYFQFTSTELSQSERVELLNESDHDTYDTRGMNFTVEAVDEWLDGLGIPKRKLNTFVLLRSNDIGLGNPFNIAQYAVLSHMVAQVTNHAPGELIWAGVDVHAYLNHLEPLAKQLERSSIITSDARLILNPDIKNIDDFEFEDIKIEGYEHQPFISMEVAV